MVSSNDEFWEWRERLFLLRGKYKDTPPGFRSDEEALREWERFIREKEEYAARNRHRIQASYCPPEEPFVGREGYLEEIQRRFQEWESPVVLYGIGGIGKTALARAYIRKHRQDYDAVLFLSCQADLKSVICDDCQLPIVNLQYSADKYGNKNRYFKEKIKVLQDIAGETRLLLVFDDCNMDRDAKMATVFSLPCHILVTTRMDLSVWGAYKGIRIRELETDKEWAQFVGADQDRKLTPEEIKAILEYREQVNGHTLFMMMRVRGIEIQGDLLDTVARDLLSRFRLGKMEKQALRELSIMPVQGISRSLYRKVSRVTDRAVDCLADHLLVRREMVCGADQEDEKEDEILSLHPLIAEAARAVFAPSLENCHKLVDGFSHLLYYTWNRTYLQNQRMEPYVFALISAFPRPLPWLARQLDTVATFLWIQGYYDEAESWYRKGYEVLEKCPSFDKLYYQARTNACSKISRIFRYQGEYQSALELIEEALRHAEALREESERGAWYDWEGNWEVLYHYALLDKAKILLGMERNEEAEALCREGLGYVRRVQEKKGAEEFRENEFKSVLVEVLAARGEFGQAKELCRDMVEKAERYRGRYFKDTLSCREQLGDVCMAAGDFREAGEEYEAVRSFLCREYPYQEEWIRRIDEKLSGSRTARPHMAGENRGDRM